MKSSRIPAVKKLQNPELLGRWVQGFLRAHFDNPWFPSLEWCQVLRSPGSNLRFAPRPPLMMPRPGPLGESGGRPRCRATPRPEWSGCLMRAAQHQCSGTVSFPDRCGSVGLALSCKAKGPRFNSRSGRMRRLWVWPPVGTIQEATDRRWFSLT